MKEILHRQNLSVISLPSFSRFANNVSAGNHQRVLVDESGIINNQMGTHNVPEMVSVQDSS
jgi:hypothetical protein